MLMMPPICHLTCPHAWVWINKNDSPQKIQIVYFIFFVRRLGILNPTEKLASERSISKGEILRVIYSLINFDM